MNKIKLQRLFFEKLTNLLLLSFAIFNFTSTSLFTLNAQTKEDFQESKQIINAKGLRIDLKENTQDPETKIVRLDMIIYSDIDSDRVKITWTLKGNARFVNEKERIQAISIRKNNVYKISVNIIPTGVNNEGFGVTEVLGDIEAFFVNTSVVASARKIIFSNINGEVIVLKERNGESIVEPPDEYLNAKNLINIRNILTAIIVIFVISATGFFGYKAFIKYLNTDDRR